MFGFAIPIGLKAFFGGAASAVSKATSALFRFFTTSPGVWIGVALLAGGIVWKANDMGFEQGVRETKAEHALELAQARAEAAEQGRNDQITVDLAIMSIREKAAYERGKAEAKTVTIIKEVPIYVTAETDAAFPVPCGVYRVLRGAQDQGRRALDR